MEFTKEITVKSTATEVTMKFTLGSEEKLRHLYVYSDSGAWDVSSHLMEFAEEHGG